MDFVKKMKKREFIEMTMKTLIGLLVAFIVIILMEGMIYGIELHALKTKGKNSTSYSDSTIAYCMKEDEDKYFVIYYNPATDTNEAYWSAVAEDYKTRAQCEGKAESGNVVAKEIVWHAPNAFKFSISASHYVVMAVFVAAVAGFFVYRFIALDKTYKKLEKTYAETGKLDI